jgi:hypothetical protein
VPSRGGYLVATRRLRLPLEEQQAQEEEEEEDDDDVGEVWDVDEAEQVKRVVKRVPKRVVKPPKRSTNGNLKS